MFPYLFLLASPSLPPSLSHPSRWSQSTELISLCYAIANTVTPLKTQGEMRSCEGPAGL